MHIPHFPKSRSASSSQISSDCSSLSSTEVQPHSGLESRFEQMKSKLDGIGMISGKAAVAISGLVKEHAAKLADYAKRNDVWIAFRPVNRHSTTLISEGAAVKGLDDTHLKSASSGPMAGFIPIDKRLSKNADQVIGSLQADYQPEIDVQKEGIVAAPLRISEARLQELRDKNLIRPGIEPDTLECGNPTFSQDEAINSLFSFRLVKQPDGTHLVKYRAHQPGGQVPEWQDVEVVSRLDGPLQKPIHLTADYDLHSIMPNMANLGSARQPFCYPLPSKTEPLAARLRNLLQARKEGAISQAEFRQEAIIKGVLNTARNRFLGQTERTRPSPVTGARNSWQTAITEDLNQLLRPENYDPKGNLLAGSSGELIKHGTEMDNPHPEGDETILFITPLGKTYMTQSAKQVQQVVQVARQYNYLHYENRHTETALLNNQKLQPGLKVEETPLTPRTRPKLPSAGQTEHVDRRHSGLLDFLNSRKSRKHAPISREPSDLSAMSLGENSSCEFSPGFRGRSSLPRLNLDSYFQETEGWKKED